MDCIIFDQVLYRQQNDESAEHNLCYEYISTENSFMEISFSNVIIKEILMKLVDARYIIKNYDIHH